MASELAEVRRKLDSARTRLSSLRNERDRASRSDPLNPNYLALPRITKDIKDVSDQISQLEIHERRLLDAEAAKSEEMQRLRLDRLEEREEFWFRRFHTSLAIAHGGAFAAIASNAFDSSLAASAAQALLWPMGFFSAGMLMAGAIPAVLYARKLALSWVLALSSAATFAAGLGAALMALARL